MNAQSQAIAQVETIVAMMAAYEMDWDRFEELKDFDSEDFDSEEEVELQQLAEWAGDYADRDAAYDAIIDDPLSIEFRSDWVPTGEKMTRNEYRIVLCTGGPHVELRGEFDHRDSPCNVRVLFKDWGESGELYEFDRDVVMSYVRMLIGE